ITTLLISVKTEFSAPGTLPKKSFAHPMSASKPTTELFDPTDTPKFLRLSSQLVRVAQFELPPKLNPMYGVTKPSTCTGTAETASRTALQAATFSSFK